jgi:hypothetical protein
MKITNIVIAAIATIPSACVAFAPSSNFATIGKVAAPKFSEQSRLFAEDDVSFQ